MSFYPDVYPDDPFQPSAILFNDLQHKLNQCNGMQSPRVYAGGLRPVEILVYNNTASDMNDAEAVTLPENGTMADTVVPCRKYDGSGVNWGILSQPLEPGEIGNCILAGPAKVKISNASAYQSGCYVKPDADNPDTFLYCDEGMVPIAANGEEAMVNVGSYGYSTMEDSLTPFLAAISGNAIRVNSGYVSCNGSFRTIAAQTFSAPASGMRYICVECIYQAASHSYTSRITMETAPDANHHPVAIVYREPMFNQLRVINSNTFVANFYFDDDSNSQKQ